MPSFRFKFPPPGLEDATYLHDENPDETRYDEVTDLPVESADDEAVAVSEPEESE